jgi:hypothetical protein
MKANRRVRWCAGWILSGWVLAGVLGQEPEPLGAGVPAERDNGVGVEQGDVGQVQGREEAMGRDDREPGLPPIEWRRVSDRVRVFSDAVIAADEEAAEVVVVFGALEMQGRVRGDVVVVWGRARIDGEVSGDVVAPLTDLELGPNTHIRGSLVAVGGELKVDPAARVDGERVEIGAGDIPGWRAVRRGLVAIKDWGVQGVLMGRLLPPQWGWWWWVALAMSLLYLLVVVVAPRPVAAGVRELETRPVSSFFVGILGYVLGSLLLLMLAATGFGLLALPFIVIALFIVQFVGKASVYQLVGQRIAAQFGGGVLGQPLPALLIGLVLFTLVYMIPVLGLLAWLALAPLGFGAALMGMFQALKVDRPAGMTGGVANGPSVHAAAHPAGSQPDHPVDGLTPPVIGQSAGGVGGADLATLPRAGFWIRLAATSLDLLIVGAVLGFLGLIEFFLIPWIAYHVGMWSWRGTTVGGIVCGLKVARLDGQPLTFAVALIRSLASLLSGVALFLGFFWAGWTREKLAWHDLIAGTVILRMPRGVSLI